MNQCSSIEVANTNLNDDTRFRLSNISKIEGYLEIKEKEKMSKRQ